MARTIAIIQQEIFDRITANSDLSALNSISKVSIYRLLVFVVSFAIWTLEVIFDNHKKEIDIAIYEQKSGTPRWYRNMSFAFQFGFDLMVDSDQYDNTNYSQEQIAASKIIKYCSVKETSESKKLIVKVAGESGELLTPLSVTQINSFLQYMEEIKYAGVGINVINSPADKLLLNMTIYRDVLVLDDQGNSILNGGKPVEKAIREYMKELPFNGELVLNDLIEKLRAVEGVNNAHITLASASAYDPVTAAYLSYMPINVRTIPVAGYFEMANFNTVTYVV